MVVDHLFEKKVTYCNVHFDDLRSMKIQINYLQSSEMLFGIQVTD